MVSKSRYKKRWQAKKKRGFAIKKVVNFEPTPSSSSTANDIRIRV